MAKKAVASLQKKSKKQTLVIKMVRKSDQHAYGFKEAIIASDTVDSWLKN